MNEYIRLLVMGALTLGSLKTINYLEAQASDEQKAGVELAVPRNQRIREVFGSHTVIPKDKPRKDPGSEQASHADRNRPVVVHPVEGKGGTFEAADLELILSSYPKSWTESEVEAVTFNTESKQLGPAYGMEGEVLAECKGGRGSERAKITYYGSSRETEVEALADVIGHELGHANDWERDLEMAEHEREELLAAVMARLESLDRFRSPYVESIKNNDKQLEKYFQATEYWAEICKQYFKNRFALNVKDFELVRQRIQKSDPDYSTKAWKPIRDGAVERVIARSRGAS